MAETTESAEKKNVINPRVEIDTSPPFESVKEAVDWFGGGGAPWVPLHLLRLASAGHEDGGFFNMEKMDEQAVQLEKDLLMKEQATLNILKELEAAKKFVRCLKATLASEASSLAASPDVKLHNHAPLPNETSMEEMSLCPHLSPGMMFMELNQAKLNLSRTSVDLAMIQASVESLNQKIRTEKLLLESKMQMQMQMPNSERILSLQQDHHLRTSKDRDQKIELADKHDVSMIISKELRQVNFEAEQFKKMTEASRYEVIKAMTEIERTKNSIKMAEMRINAAKKMEEAAKAVEAIALAEGKVLPNGHEHSSDSFLHKPDGITLSFEEYQALTNKAQETEDLCKTKFVDANAMQRTRKAQQLDVPIMEKFEEIAKENAVGLHRKNVTANIQLSENNSTKFKFRNSHPAQRSPHILNENRSTKEQLAPSFTSTTSIGDILSRKLILQDDVVAGRHEENHPERRHISLSEMLREQSRLILHSPKLADDHHRKIEKQYFIQRKKFGFIHVPMPTKKKTHPLNVR